MDWGDLITRTAAALGASLGLFNSWQNWRHHRVRIRVTPITVTVKRTVARDSHGGEITQPFLSPGVAIVNLSSFPVTLEEVGYELKAGETYRLSRIDAPARWSTMGSPILEELPKRLEARSSIRLSWWDEDEQSLKGKRINRAYARTACGTLSHGRNRTLRKMASRLAQGSDVVEAIEQKGN